MIPSNSATLDRLNRYSLRDPSRPRMYHRYGGWIIEIELKDESLQYPYEAYVFPEEALGLGRSWDTGYQTDWDGVIMAFEAWTLDNFPPDYPPLDDAGAIAEDL